MIGAPHALKTEKWKRTYIFRSYFYFVFHESYRNYLKMNLYETHLYDLINGMPMFEQFSENEKMQFAEMQHSVIGFKNGETIIAEGDESFSMFLLISGRCIITKEQDGINLRLAKIGAGELFGEMSFFTQKPRQTNVIANGSVMVMKMDEDFFKKVDPEVRDKIKNHIILLLISRLNTMDDSVMRTSKLMRLSR